MTDRRNASGLQRMMDPEWAFISQAADLLYQEVEIGSACVTVNIAVANPDGSVTTYGLNRHEPASVQRALVVDVDALAEAIERGMIQTTPGAADG